VPEYARHTLLSLSRAHPAQSLGMLQFGHTQSNFVMVTNYEHTRPPTYKSNTARMNSLTDV